MTELERSWADATIAGFRALGSSHPLEAAKHWLAGAELGPFPALDPRRATSRTNEGAAHVLRGEKHAAEAALADAEHLWSTYAQDIPRADVSLPGQSSSFHFRLASRNLQAFEAVQRRRLAEQCGAGLAIARFNLLLAGAGGAFDATAAPTLAALLSDVLGSQTPEVRLLLGASLDHSAKTVAADSLYAEKAAELELQRSAAVRGLGDELKILKFAVAHTVLLTPGLVHDREPEARDNHQLISSDKFQSTQ